MAGDLLTLADTERAIALRIRDMLEDQATTQAQLFSLVKSLDPITVTKIAYHNDEFRARPVKPEDREVELSLYTSDRPTDFISLCKTEELQSHWENLVRKQTFAGHSSFRWRPLPTIHPFDLLRGSVFCNGCYADGLIDASKDTYLTEAAKLGCFLPKLEEIDRSVRHFCRQNTLREPNALIKEAEKLADLYPGPGTIVLAIVYSDLAKHLATMPDPDCKETALAYSGFALFRLEQAKSLWATSDDAIANATLSPQKGRTLFFKQLREFYPRAECNSLQDLDRSLAKDKLETEKENLPTIASRP